MLADFTDILAEKCTPAGISLNQWTGCSRSTRNLLELSVGKRTALLYVRESNTDVGWWGLTPSRLQCFSDSGLRWFTVFLGRSTNTTYIANAQDVEERIGYVWRQAQDTNFKVHENAEMLGLARITHAEAADYFVHLLTQEREKFYHDFISGSQEIADFMLRLPGRRSGVARINHSSTRFVDLLASLFAFGLVPGTGVAETTAKLLPIFARMFEVLKDDEALIVRAMCEFSAGADPVPEDRLFRGVNAELNRRGQRAMTEGKFDALLEKLAAKECIEPFPGTTGKWRIRGLMV